jgi:AraC family transcriptional regulator of adaptative response/methylated-DNA-[protein]-cysteine methyltransferase
MQMEWSGAGLVDSKETETLLRRAFETPAEVPVMAIGTPFQLTVWEYLRRSATASTMTYGEVARAIGRPTAARAIGQAVGANHLAVVIPCHRVVSRGKLTGYRWGLELKKALLAWELARRDPLRMPF